MENKSKNKKNKKLLSYLVTGLIIVCVILLITQIVINTMEELQTNQTNDGFAVVMEYDATFEEAVSTPEPAEIGAGN